MGIKKIAVFKKIDFLFRFPLPVFVNKCKKRIANQDVWRPVRGFVSQIYAYTVVSGNVRSGGHALFRVFQKYVYAPSRSVGRRYIFIKQVFNGFSGQNPWKCYFARNGMKRLRMRNKRFTVFPAAFRVVSIVRTG
jgi:hypothetical protein